MGRAMIADLTRAAWNAGLVLTQATAEALLAGLLVLVIGIVATLAWYLLVEGAPPLTPVAAAWRSDAPIALGLFLPPALTALAAALACVTRFVAACWQAVFGR